MPTQPAKIQKNRDPIWPNPTRRSIRPVDMNRVMSYPECKILKQLCSCDYYQIEFNWSLLFNYYRFVFFCSFSFTEMFKKNRLTILLLWHSHFIIDIFCRLHFRNVDSFWKDLLIHHFLDMYLWIQVSKFNPSVDSFWKGLPSFFKHKDYKDYCSSILVHLFYLDHFWKVLIFLILSKKF